MRPRHEDGPAGNGADPNSHKGDATRASLPPRPDFRHVLDLVTPRPWQWTAGAVVGAVVWAVVR